MLDTQSNIHLMFKIANDLSGDLNTGIYFPSADTIAFTEGGAEAMRIDSSGRVGIGTTDVNGLLNVVQASNTQALLRLRNNTADTSTADGMIFTITDSSAPVGSIEMVSGGSDAVLAFRTNGSERMRISSVGEVLMGTTSGANPPSQGIANFGNISNSQIGIGHASGTASGQFYVAFGFNAGLIGGITQNGTTAVAYNTTSDYRLKENVNYNFDATTRLKQLKPARFNFIIEPNRTVDGFLAHEVQDIIPEAITGTKDETVTKEKVVVNANGQVIAENIKQADWEAGKIPNEEGKSQYPVDSTWEASKVVPVYQGIDQAKLTPLLTKALQEAIAKIEQLEARLTALES